MPKPKNSDLITLDKVVTLVKELTGVTRCRCTVYNWARKGRANQHGEVIKLKTYKRLGQHYTTKECVIEFLRAL